MTRKCLPDSIAGNPQVGQLLTRLFATKKIKKETKPRSIYEDEKYKSIMAPVNWEKFRKHFMSMYKDHFGDSYAKRTFTLHS